MLAGRAVKLTSSVKLFASLIVKLLTSFAVKDVEIVFTFIPHYAFRIGKAIYD